MAYNGVSQRMKRCIRERDDWTCVICGAWGHEVDHKVPIRDGGGHTFRNLRVLCRDCHIKKSRKERPHYTQGRAEWLDHLDGYKIERR